MTEQLAGYPTPTVEAYALMQQHERDRAAKVFYLNQRLRKERAKTLDQAIKAEQRTRARTINTARADARREANEEVDGIFLDEYTRERVRAFEAYPMRQKSYGDIEACAAESAEYDKRHPKP